MTDPIDDDEFTDVDDLLRWIGHARTEIRALRAERDALREASYFVERLRTAKGRGRDLPVPVLVGTPQTLEGLGYGLTKAARDLAEAFWPGPLTLVVEKTDAIPDLVTAGGSTRATRRRTMTME